MNSYQAIIISDRATTYSVFTYNCNELDWFYDAYEENAAVGYSVLGTAENLQNFANHPLSRKAGIGKIACTNLAESVPWVNVVYKIGVASAEQVERRQCLARVDRDRILFPQGLGRFQFALTDCPCFLSQAERDFRFMLDFTGTNPDAADSSRCYFSRFSIFDSSSFSRIRYRCCYSLRFVPFSACCLLAKSGFE